MFATLLRNPSARRLAAVSVALRPLATRNMALKVGDRLPEGVLTEGTPAGTVNLTELFAGKRGVLIGVPGAFTPGCSKTHLPGYVERFDALTAKGIQVVACMSVNDAFVMEAWGKAHGADGKVRMLADADGTVTKKMGFEVDLTKALGNVRCRRFSMLVEDNVVKVLNLEDGGAMTCSLAPDLLKQI